MTPAPTLAQQDRPFGLEQTVDPTALPGSAASRLRDALDRAARAPREKALLVVHLSRLTPWPLPYHLRVARMFLKEAAERLDGQLLPMDNLDLALLCTAPDEFAEADDPHSVVVLAQMLGKLFASAMPGGAPLISFWKIDQEALAVRAYVASAGQAVREPEERPGRTASVIGLEAAILQAPVGDLVQQKIGMSLNPDRVRPLAARLAPAFLELSVGLAAFKFRPPVADALFDPFLVQHAAGAVDVRLLEALRADLDGHGRLTRGALADGLPLHVALAPAAILSTGFALLARSARQTGAKVAVQFSMLQACADPDPMEQAIARVKLAGFEFVLGGVDAATLAIADPAGWQPDIVKLSWSQELAASGGALVRQAGAACVVLSGTDTDEALSWGHAAGIRRFQGPFVDAIQAVTRMARCPGATACTLRQCRGRAASFAEAARIGCTNLPLLDAPYQAAP